MEAVRGSLCLGLAIIMLMGSAAATRVQADPVTWSHLCAAVGDFAGLLATHRDDGMSARDAIAMTGRLFSDGPPELLDRAVTDEIARQVYATPALTPRQESVALKARCLTPDVGARSRTPRPAIPSEHVVTHLVPIPLDKGVNHVGPDVEIVLDWHDDGGGHGHDVFVVTIPTSPGPSDGRFMPANAVAPAERTIADDPHDGDDVLAAVRFARGDVDGQQAILLLRATRLSPAAKVVPTPTVFEIDRLVPGDSGSGSQPAFERVERRTLARRFCNADMALSVASGLPLRLSYRGPRDADGQFTANGCPESMAPRP
jgi:hypothetical protein